MYFDKIFMQMVIQNDLYCSIVISFPALASVELKRKSTPLLFGGGGGGVLWAQVPLSEKGFVNFLASFQI